MGSIAMPGAIGVCQDAFHSAWRLTRSFPVDDRQYYSDIQVGLDDDYGHSGVFLSYLGRLAKS